MLKPKPDPLARTGDPREAALVNQLTSHIEALQAQVEELQNVVQARDEAIRSVTTAQKTDTTTAAPTTELPPTAVAPPSRTSTTTTLTTQQQQQPLTPWQQEQQEYRLHHRIPNADEDPNMFLMSEEGILVEEEEPVVSSPLPSPPLRQYESGSWMSLWQQQQEEYRQERFRYQRQNEDMLIIHDHEIQRVPAPRPYESAPLAPRSQRRTLAEHAGNHQAFAE